MLPRAFFPGEEANQAIIKQRALFIRVIGSHNKRKFFEKKSRLGGHVTRSCSFQCTNQWRPIKPVVRRLNVYFGEGNRGEGAKVDPWDSSVFFYDRVSSSSRGRITTWYTLTPAMGEDK